MLEPADSRARDYPEGLNTNELWSRALDITVFENAEGASRALARRVTEALRRSPDLVLGLPAGRTPVAAYAELRRLYLAGEADFSQAKAFLLDEFVGLAPSHTGSFRRFVAEHLLSAVNEVFLDRLAAAEL